MSTCPHDVPGVVSCYWCDSTPDEDRPWWRWHNSNPDVLAIRKDGVRLEQVTRRADRRDGWQASTGLEMWAPPGDFIQHDRALAAYDIIRPREDDP